MKFIRSKYFKYIIVVLIFGIWLSFFDDCSWSKRGQLNKHLKELQEKLKETNNAISQRETEAKMTGNMKFIETIARDNYYMKGDDEDLFIFLTENENGNLVSFEK